MIKLVRCDDRLIHGQCVLRIIPRYEVTDIIVVDNETASNPIVKKIFLMAAPKGVRTQPVTVAEAVPLIKAAMQDSSHTLLLMKTPETMAQLLEQIPDLPKELNIASLPSTPGKTKIATGIYFNEAQMNAVKKMDEEGVHIYLQLVPDDPKIEWANIKSNY